MPRLSAPLGADGAWVAVVAVGRDPVGGGVGHIDGRGVMLMRHTLDNHLQLHGKPVPRRVREALFALDGLVEHDTELDPRVLNGAKWRSVPAELGPWWMAAQTFIRWSRLNVWERLLVLVQEQGVQLGMTFLDGTSIRAHQKALSG